MAEKSGRIGGRRPGAGRPKGSPNKATIARQEAIAASGLTPLDYLLKVMRDEMNEIDVRLEAARAAAPYVHPRLASVDVSNRDGVPFVINIKRFGDEAS